jgi:hypothetical protein
MGQPGEQNMVNAHTAPRPPFVSPRTILSLHTYRRAASAARPNSFSDYFPVCPRAPVCPRLPPFSHANVVAEAKRLAARPFVLPSTVPQALGKLTYDLYRQIRFRKDRAV